MAPKPMPLADRFWRHVNKEGECWLWTGATRRGYGALWIGTRNDGGHQPAHRVSFELANGPVPPGLMVLHRCDVRACVRPDHLFLGDHKINMADMAAKGRAASGLHHGRHTKPGSTPRGELNGNAKLTMRAAIEIRERYASGGVSSITLAAEYGVSKKTVLNILHGKIWR